MNLMCDRKGYRSFLPGIQTRREALSRTATTSSIGPILYASLSLSGRPPMYGPDICYGAAPHAVVEKASWYRIRYKVRQLCKRMGQIMPQKHFNKIHRFLRLALRKTSELRVCRPTMLSTPDELLAARMVERYVTDICSAQAERHKVRAQI